MFSLTTEQQIEQERRILVSIQIKIFAVGRAEEQDPRCMF